MHRRNRGRPAGAVDRVSAGHDLTRRLHMAVAWRGTPRYDGQPREGRACVALPPPPEALRSFRRRRGSRSRNRSRSRSRASLARQKRAALRACLQLARAAATMSSPRRRVRTRVRGGRLAVSPTDHGPPPPPPPLCIVARCLPSPRRWGVSRAAALPAPSFPAFPSASETSRKGTGARPAAGCG